MEFTRKIKYIFLLFILFLLNGCKSAELVSDPLVLLEITPLPKTVQLKKEVVYEPIYGMMRVLEIGLENGVQTELTAKVGDVKTGVEKGVTGDIAADSSFGEIIGTFKIISVSNGFVTCKIENVTGKIPNNAYIRVVIGEKIKEE